MEPNQQAGGVTRVRFEPTRFRLSEPQGARSRVRMLLTDLVRIPPVTDLVRIPPVAAL